MERLLTITLVALMALAVLSTAGLNAMNTMSTANAAAQSKPTLSMTAIDVGRGDALLLTYPNGKHVLVDAGEEYAARTYVIPYLIQHKVTHLDAIVCTHEHSDHLDGLISLLKDRRFTVDTAYDTGFPLLKGVYTANKHERDSIDAYVRLLSERHITRTTVQAGATIDVGKDNDKQKNAITYVISPSAALTKSLAKDIKDTQGINNHDAINENSVVLRVYYKEVRYLLAGDTGRSGNKYADYSMLHDPVQKNHLSSDVLKLGHHGYNTPDTVFFDFVGPSYVVMTFGPIMSTSVPQCEGLKTGTQNFDYFKDRLWSTCDKGTITVSTDGTSKNIKVQAEGSSVPQACCCSCFNKEPSHGSTLADVAA